MQPMVILLLGAVEASLPKAKEAMGSGTPIAPAETATC
jgi:hypothetical protein